MAKDHKLSVGELEDELKVKERRIEELRLEIDEQRELIDRLRENSEEADGVFEAWIETFVPRDNQDERRATIRMRTGRSV